MRAFRCAVLGLALVSARAGADESTKHLVGFTAHRASGQLDLEQRYDRLLKADNLRTWMQRMTVRPHHLGSPQAKANAEFIAEQFRSWGYDTKIEVFHVLFPTPKLRELVLLEPRRFVASPNLR